MAAGSSGPTGTLPIVPPPAVRGNNRNKEERDEQKKARQPKELKSKCPRVNQFQLLRVDSCVNRGSPEAPSPLAASNTRLISVYDEFFCGPRVRTWTLLDSLLWFTVWHPLQEQVLQVTLGTRSAVVCVSAWVTSGLRGGTRSSFVCRQRRPARPRPTPSVGATRLRLQRRRGGLAQDALLWTACYQPTTTCRPGRRKSSLHRRPPGGSCGTPPSLNRSPLHGAQALAPAGACFNVPEAIHSPMANRWSQRPPLRPRAQPMNMLGYCPPDAKGQLQWHL